MEHARASRPLFVSSVIAGDTYLVGQNSIEIGITFEYDDAEDPSCNLGYGHRVLYYFAEVITYGLANCYNQGVASWDEVHLESVLRNAQTGYWKAYRDGSFVNVQTQWTVCNGGLACGVTAMGEEHHENTGSIWPAKFAGSSQHQWERCCVSGYPGGWYPIQQAQPKTDADWSLTGPFPAGIWTAKYVH
jgi:hypothetical protein